jgi:hypothetical protein
MAADETGGASNQNGDAAEAGCAIHGKDTGPILLRGVGQFEIGVVSLNRDLGSNGPRPRSQRISASIASSYHDQCARARNIFILGCGTKDHVLLEPQSRQRINSGRSPCRRIASENRGA